MNYQNALDYIVLELENFPNKYNESYWILEFITQKDKAFILSNAKKQIPVKQIESMKILVSKRKKYYPLQYLLGTVDFMGYTFKTCTNVLIPREDTSVLVDYILDNAKPHQNCILEIGIGSGIISLTLKKKNPVFKILGTDINPKAIECTLINERELFKKNGNIKLQETSLFNNIQGKFDIIVSNPPYITKNELAVGNKELQFEPLEALVAENEGMFFYEEILKQGIHFLNPDGFFVLEISPLRRNKVIDLVKSMQLTFFIFYDLSGQERGIVINNF